jgi:hypothetical protein
MARGNADVLYVADAFEVMVKVIAMLAEKKTTTVRIAHVGAREN